MFNKPIHLEMIDVNSKMSLKISCLRACDNNVERARELYEFLSEGIQDFPDLDPIRPGGFEQVKQGAADIFKWLAEHKDDISQGVAFVQSLRKSAPASIPNDTIPPIPKI